MYIFLMFSCLSISYRRRALLYALMRSVIVMCIACVSPLFALVAVLEAASHFPVMRTVRMASGIELQIDCVFLKESRL